MGNKKILVVDDDPGLRELLQEYLTAQGYAVRTVADGAAMDDALRAEAADLVILDLMLPGDDGLTLARRLKMRGHLPVIMLSARGEDVDRIIGLEVGADDYLAKPFNPRELLARIRAVLRRVPNEAAAVRPARTLNFQGWRLDCLMRELTSPQGAQVAITGAEFDLLRVFCERPRRVLSRDQLLDFTQGRNAGSLERSIDVLVSRLRRKIEIDQHHPEIIKTVRSGGYLFTAAVESS